MLRVSGMPPGGLIVGVRVVLGVLLPVLRWGVGLLILCMIPIIIFYTSCQRYIVKGVTDGAVKG